MSFEQAPPASLADLIELDVEPRRVWRVDELGSILLHELSLPLSVGTGEITLTAAEVTDASTGTGLARLLTLGALLHHPRPPLILLERVKERAKAARHDPSGHLPEDVAAVVYALAIAAALLRHGRRITSLSERAVAEYFDWTSQREWLDDASRRLLRDARQRLPGDDVAQ